MRTTRPRPPTASRRRCPAPRWPPPARTGRTTRPPRSSGAWSTSRAATGRRAAPGASSRATTGTEPAPGASRLLRAGHPRDVQRLVELLLGEVPALDVPHLHDHLADGLLLRQRLLGHLG